ncbi:hypothetical protein [Streptomyces cylindrosporus]|uniref:Uncharacterized protein n=1 Tax=Streptomyces cylindrosporus TaxID=2927583 RepID=A0ABS9YKU7_9ACTN|nr:hypothetical protein [Streptomyces cylindrosporus]MCI3277529.1 hypothetical protein [Streptomyces cylindrosporus]
MVEIQSSTSLKVTEKSKRDGITFAELCELVDKGRELGVDPSTLVSGDTWIRNRPGDREGYRLRYLEL